MTTSDELRNQAKELREAARKIDDAAETLESFGKTKAKAPLVEKNSASPKKTQGFVISEGVRKNQDLCYDVIKAAGHPLQVDDIVKAIQAKGSNVKKATTVTLYLRFDEKKRFTRPEPGVWSIV